MLPCLTHLAIFGACETSCRGSLGWGLRDPVRTLRQHRAVSNSVRGDFPGSHVETCFWVVACACWSVLLMPAPSHHRSFFLFASEIPGCNKAPAAFTASHLPLHAATFRAGPRGALSGQQRAPGFQDALSLSKSVLWL